MTYRPHAWLAMAVSMTVACSGPPKPAESPSAQGPLPPSTGPTAEITLPPDLLIAAAPVAEKTVAPPPKPVAREAAASQPAKSPATKPVAAQPPVTKPIASQPLANKQVAAKPPATKPAVAVSPATKPAAVEVRAFKPAEVVSLSKPPIARATPKPIEPPPVVQIAPPTPASTRPTVDLFDPARHLHTAEVHPGMTGYGLSVFHGTAIDRFDVQVISVLRNQDGPDHNIILIRCQGQGLEHSGAVEGMSGSPIYLVDDKGRTRLAGAFALGWENNKDPIAGVRPIEEMLRVPTAASPAATRPSKTSAGQWDARSLIAGLDRSPKPMQHDSSHLTRLALPLAVGGVNDAAFHQLAPLLKLDGLMPVQGGRVAGSDADPDARLEPGAAIGIPVVTGDLDVSALGTVTEVIGDKIFAFGHEFNSEGPVDLPMGIGYVHTVIPANTISFKLGSLMRLDGAIHNDESVAIAGNIGKVPAMIPITVVVKTAQHPAEKTYHFQVARHPKFTPMGVVTALTAAITADSGLASEFTVRYTMRMTFDGGQTVDFADTATSATKATQLARDLNLPLTLALQNPFGRSYPTAITARFEVEPRVRLDEIKSVTCDKLIYKPGDSIELFVNTQAYDGGLATRHASFGLPDDLPEGDYTLTVGDADRTLADEMHDAPYRFEVRSLAEVYDLIRQVSGRPSPRLYVRLSSHDAAVSTGRTPLAGLPASRVRVLSRPGSAGVMAYVPSMVRDLPWPSPLSGSVDIEVKVSKTPEKSPRPTPQPAAVPVPPAGNETEPE